VKALALRGRRPSPARPSARGLPRILEKSGVRLYRAAAWALGRVPQSLAAGVVGELFELSYRLWPAKRRSSNENFAHVLGLPPDHPRVRRLALAAYHEYGRYLTELMRIPQLPPDEVGRLVTDHELDGIEPIWRESKGGLIFAVGHVGNNEAVAAGIAKRGWPMNVVADDSTMPEMFELLRRNRESWGVHVIAWRNLREIYTVLRRREMLALLIDWGYRPDGVPVRLFGEWTTLPAGPAALAAKTGSRILPVAIRRRDNGTFRVSWSAPIEVASSAPADLVRATQAMADALEATIAAAPDQWYSFKPMWPSTAAESAALEQRALAAQAGEGPAITPAAAEIGSGPKGKGRRPRLEVKPS
jgi:phosphatidylinositol dimannoside acyltransferase